MKARGSTNLRGAGKQGIVERYLGFHDDEQPSGQEVRLRGYVTMVNDYYDLVTDFYEFGWGESFHFAPLRKGQRFQDALACYERYVAERLELGPGMRVLDVGCGVGGPMREIARYSGATIVGVNNNAYQLQRGLTHNARDGLSRQCSFLKADFMDLPVWDASFDGIYAIEATPHAPNKTQLFRELLRVLKPAGGFAGYEWCLTDKYDPANPEHRAIKKGLEVGTSLPDLASMREVDDALRAAGFEFIVGEDRALEADPNTPWYLPLRGQGLWCGGFFRSPVGRAVTNVSVRVLECLHIAPRGSTAVSTFLNAAAETLVRAGESGIFTPMYFFHARKPE